MMRLLLLTALLCCAAGCSMMRNADEALAKLNDGLGKVNSVVSKVEAISATAQAKIEEVKANADTDKDGSISWGELLAYLTAGGGGLGLVVTKLVSLQKQANELYDRTHTPVGGIASPSS